MKQNNKKTVEVLFPINCRYNFKVRKNGICYSKKCMLNQNLVVSQKIAKNGCKAYLSDEVQKLLNKKENGGI